MPDTSSGRYQSKFFNFLQQQSRRLGEGLGRSLRQLKVNTHWSLEALLQSVVLMMQKAVESAGKQLQPGEQQPKLQLTETLGDTDTPIQKILQVAEGLQLQNQTVSNLPPISIQGIASQIGNRNLVLVNVGNEILETLTPQQQEELKAKIIQEVAEYYHYQQGNIIPQQQTGVAIPQSTPTDSSRKSSTNNQALTFIDATIAKLESTITPVSRVGKKIFTDIQTQVNVFVYGKQHITRRSKPRKSQIHTKISTVSHLLLGNHIPGETNISTNTVANNKIPSASKTPLLQHQSVADPWLTLDDLFDATQEAGEITDNQHSPSSSSSLTTNTVLPPSQSPECLPQNLSNHYQKLLQQPQPGAGLVKKPKQTRDITPTPKTPTTSSITPFKTDNHQGEIIIPQQPQNTQLEAKPDWIETKAKMVGYDKHPLVQILEWLDILILWIEKIVVKIFAFLQILLRGK